MRVIEVVPDPTDQPLYHFRYLLGAVAQISAFVVRDGAAVHRSLQLILKLACGAKGNVKKPEKLALAVFCSTFGEVGARRQCRFEKLPLERLMVSPANAGNHSVDVDKERVGLVEHEELSPKHHPAMVDGRPVLARIVPRSE